MATLQSQNQANGLVADEDLAFLAAWEEGILPRSIDAATILRVRQMKRAKEAVTFLGSVGI